MPAPPHTSEVLTDAAQAAEAVFLETAVPTGRDWPQPFESRGEIGAYKAMKRGLSRGGSFREEWRAAEGAWVRQAAGALRPGAMAALVLGDGAGIGGLESARESAVATGLFTEIAAASIRQSRGGDGDGGEEVESDSGSDAPYPGDAAMGEGVSCGAPPGNRRTEHFLLLERCSS